MEKINLIIPDNRTLSEVESSIKSSRLFADIDITRFRHNIKDKVLEVELSVSRWAYLEEKQ